MACSSELQRLVGGVENSNFSPVGVAHSVLVCGAGAENVVKGKKGWVSRELGNVCGGVIYRNETKPGRR